jgi:SRSO17 transposase
MNLRSVDRSKLRFAAYVEGLVSVIGHADRASPLRDYCLGLIMPCERKSVEPMAAITAPDRTAAQHQSLLHFVGQSPWSNEKVLAKVGEMVLPAIERHGPIEAWIIDDTGFPKKGQHSVGVARQYCGQLGKQDNCQVAVSLSLANHHASLPVAWRLYLPKEWAADHERRRKAGVPDEIDFKTKPEIALEQIGAALKAGLSRGVVLMDAGYGCNTDLRTGISALALTYVAGILPNTTVWTPGTGPLPPKKWSGCGRRPMRLGRDNEHKPISVEELALGLPKRSWRRIEWREGTAEPLSSRFARVRVRVAHRDYARSESRPEEWLLIEWPESEEKPAKYWLSTLPKNITFRKLVDLTKLRWRIERLSGAQTRGRARTFRRTRLARLPPPRHAVHRRLRISGLREGEDSPLRTLLRPSVRKTCRSRT